MRLTLATRSINVPVPAASVNLRASVNQDSRRQKSPRSVRRVTNRKQTASIDSAKLAVGQCHNQEVGPYRRNQDELLLDHLPQVRAIAQQIRRRFYNADLDDLVSSGMLGLLKAIRNFDASRGVLLKTYAEYRIRGEILDGLRAMRWLSHRTQRHDSPCQQTAAPLQVTMLQIQSGDELEQIAERLGSLGKSAPDPATIYDRKERLQLLAEAISRLPQRNREVIEMRYHREMDWKQIVRLLNEREWKVYELHAGALRLLRRWLQNVNLCSADVT